MRRMQVALSALGGRLFRNNCGALRDHRGQWVRFGIANPGGSDLIGWKSITITSKMVGKRIAVFTAVEVKLPNASVTEAQQAFINAVDKEGGISFVARSIEEASRGLGEWENRF